MGVAYGAAEDTSARSASRVSVLIDPDGNVAKFYPKVSPATHADEVLADIG